MLAPKTRRRDTGRRRTAERAGRRARRPESAEEQHRGRDDSGRRARSGKCFVSCRCEMRRAWRSGDGTQRDARRAERGPSGEANEKLGASGGARHRRAGRRYSASAATSTCTELIRSRSRSTSTSLAASWFLIATGHHAQTPVTIEEHGGYAIVEKSWNCGPDRGGGESQEVSDRARGSASTRRSSARSTSASTSFQDATSAAREHVRDRVRVRRRRLHRALPDHERGVRDSQDVRRFAVMPDTSGRSRAHVEDSRLPRRREERPRRRRGRRGARLDPAPASATSTRASVPTFAKVRPTRAPPKARAEAMAPQAREFCPHLGLFLWSKTTEESEMSELEEKHYIGRAAVRARGARVGAGDARRDGRPEVLRPARHVAARLAAARRLRRVARSRRGSASTARRSAAGRGSPSRDMLLMPDASSAILDPFTEVPTLSLICEIVDPLTREPYARDPRCVAAARRGVPARDRHRRHRVLRPRVRVLRLRRGLLRARPEPRRTTASTRPRATGTPASPGSATRSARRRATSRPRRTTRCTTCARRWC